MPAQLDRHSRHSPWKLSNYSETQNLWGETPEDSHGTCRVKNSKKRWRDFEGKTP